jgi:hypothetical protein
MEDESTRITYQIHYSSMTFFFFLSEKDVFVLKKIRNDITEILLKVALKS